MKKPYVGRLAETHLYVLAIVLVAVLIIINQVIIHTLLSEVRKDAFVINIAGKQRMLSQRITKLALMSINDPRNFIELKKETEIWNRTHFGLQRGNAEIGLSANNSKEISKLLGDIDPYQKGLYLSILSLGNSSQIRGTISEILRNEEAYLPLMDSIVDTLEKESQARVRRLEVVEILLAVVSLLLLTAEFLFIFRPIIKELKTREQKLERLNESKDLIMATIAHDIRNPLNIIQISLDLLKERIPDISAKNVETLMYAQDACSRAEKLIRELLELSQIESEEFSLTKEITKLDPYVVRVLSPFRYQASEKQIEIKITVHPPDLSAMIDRDRFARVLENLITNSLKFTEESGKIEINSFEEKGKVWLEIKDTGIGIPEKLKEYVFDKYSKARRKGMLGEKTVGLGMWIVKTIVEKHQGKIWLESQEGLGTTFYVCLPKENLKARNGI
ncbi:GHKL domain protein [Leptospira broomii serovar Hurstbridge str. 5399]|uniref:histidine kinase n=1 Tax=Leptospira broomii serovar Hurstbridge str. 5399 TaxID=1049789 RepID=T0F703_9LEPT|nr:ATP-binding protein [Leptospira broomii]EQA43302.1 GHKL domain protein [Leptospira broomii serovar Hurstbridge str. 5399]